MDVLYYVPTYTYMHEFDIRVLYAWELHCPTVCANIFLFNVPSGMWFFEGSVVCI